MFNQVFNISPSIHWVVARALPPIIRKPPSVGLVYCEFTSSIPFPFLVKWLGSIPGCVFKATLNESNLDKSRLLNYNFFLCIRVLWAGRISNFILFGLVFPFYNSSIFLQPFFFILRLICAVLLSIDFLFIFFPSILHGSIID